MLRAIVVTGLALMVLAAACAPEDAAFDRDSLSPTTSDPQALADGPCDWPMWGFDLERHFSYPCSTGISPDTVDGLRRIWFVNTSDVVTASPVVVDGRLYVGDWAGRFYALDAGTGEQIWIFDAADGCENLISITTTSGNPCESLAVQWPLAAGTYWLVVAPVAFADDAACGVAYTALALDKCPEDLDGDGLVGINDFLALLAAWGMVDVPADFDGGGVGITDFLQLLAAWGGC